MNESLIKKSLKSFFIHNFNWLALTQPEVDPSPSLWVWVWVLHPPSQIWEICALEAKFVKFTKNSE